MKGEENKKVFQRLLYLIFKYIKDKSIKDQKAGTQAAAKPSSAQNFNDEIPQPNAKGQSPGNSTNLVNTHTQTPIIDMSDQKQDAAKEAGKSSALDNMVSQLKTIKTSIFKD